MENRALSPSTPSSRGMDKYEQLAVVGEGSYGVVLKCRRRDNGQLVAIKKFLETEDDAAVRKMALREIRMLKKLRHEHLVNMIEVFRRKRRFYLVFEYLDHTLLDELESNPGGLGDDTTKKHLFQLLRGIDYCHQNSIIHRDVKPENVLISHLGVVKLCDLGFARALAAPGEPYTEYVATRWYRAPELLVADHKYGPEVDIWAIGCLFAEMLTGDPLFPGDSDIDQLALIIKTVGKLAPRHQQVVAKLAGGAALGAHRPASGTLPGSGFAKALLAACVRTEPRARPSAASLLRHKYFLAEGFMERFIAELRHKIGKNIETPVAPKQGSAVRPEKKPRNQWTLNIIPDPNSSSVEESMTGEALIDCKYTPSSASNMEIMKVREKKHQHICPNCPHCTECLTKEPKAKVDHGVVEPLPPPSKTQQNRNLGKALNDAFQTFSVPVRYPKTPYIKKVNTRLIMDEDLLKGRAGSKKLDKNFPNDFTLPNVPGASNSPVKKVKKPTNTSKGYDSWEGARGTETTDCKTPNLPYM